MRKQRFDPETWRPELPTWCERTLGSRPSRVLFEGGWQSAVVGVRLEDGRDVVVKIRLAEARVLACALVHRHAFASGFPCPEPLIPPTPIGRYVATAERYDPAGHELPSSAERVWRFAGLLVRLVRTMSPVVDLPTLDPPPDWAAWNHRGPGLWPPAAEGHVDLNAHQDPAWLANVVSRVRSRLAASTLPPVVGHVDWESKHLLWTGGAIHTVHDWDSMCALPEAGVAGLAASMFPTTHEIPGASLDESQSFLHAYAAARGRKWTREEREVAWAATLWVMAYGAKSDALDDAVGPSTVLLVAEMDERLRRAGS